MQFALIEQTTPRLIENQDGIPSHRVTDLLGQQGRAAKGPQSFYVESLIPNDVARAHFHKVNQFQVFTDGDGRIGRWNINPVFVHYADAYVPYGPIVSGPLGAQYLTIRVEGDPGPQFMPESRTMRLKLHGRHVTLKVPDEHGADVVELEPPHEDGLAVYLLEGRPGDQIQLPAGRNLGGLHLVVLDGALVCGSVAASRLSNFYLEPKEANPPLLVAKQEVRVLALFFPAPAEDAWAC
jgi:hypothetical protein